MLKNLISAAAVVALSAGVANAAVIYSTSFEQPFVAGAALNGQQGWLADSGTVANTAGGARTGTQFAQMTSANLGTGSRWAWEAASTSRTAAQLAGAPIIRASVWTSMVGTGGAANRIVTAGLDLYDISVARIGLIYIASDGSVNVLDGTATGGGTAAGFVNINVYNHLEVEANFATGTVEFFVNGVSLFIGSHLSTDFGDADIRGTRSATGTGGPTSIRFDDYSIEQNVPAPATLALMGMGLIAGGRRRR